MSLGPRFVLTLGLLGATLAPSAQQLTRLSQPEDPLALGVLADGLSEHCRIAGARWVVFSSRAANLVPEDRNASQDIFLRDRTTGLVERISVDTDGVEQRGSSLAPDVSDDGRYVVFQSQAPLAAGATNSLTSHIYLRDRALATTTLVSRSYNGAPASGFSLSARIDGPGTTVVFASSVDTLVPGDDNNATDIFAYDIATGTLTLVSRSGGDVLADAPSRLPDVADGGRYVVFASDASNLVPGDGEGQRDVFRKDRLTGAIVRLSEDAAAAGGNGLSDQPVIDASGSVVAFSSYASNFVAGDTLNRQDIFVWDESSLPRLSRVNLGAGGVQASNHSRAPAIGNSGRWIVFDSTATNLDPGQIAAIGMQPFVIDRDTGIVSAVLTSAGQSTVGPASLDSDDTRLCLASTAAFDPADANGQIRDVSSRGVAAVDWWLESMTPQPVPAPAANGASVEPETSPDGRYVVFASSATNLDADAVARESSADVYWLDRSTGAIERLPLAPGGVAPNASSGSPSVSNDGRWLSFVSAASNLVAGAGSASHVYRLDRTTGALEALSVALGGVGGGGERPHISGDGTRVVFQSTASTLVTGDTNGVRDLFLWGEGQPVTRINLAPGGGQADAASQLPRLANSGGHVVFLSTASNLAPGGSGGLDHVYLLDLATAELRRVSETAGGVVGDARARVADVSADGRHVAFVTEATNLGANRPGPDVLRWDAVSGDFADVSGLLPLDEDVDPDVVRISSDGRHVSFVSFRQVGSVFTENVWRADLDAGVLQLMSSNEGLNRNGGRIQGLALDAQGTVLFAADDDALLPGDGNGAYDIYGSQTTGAPGMIGIDASASLLEVTEGTDAEAIIAVVRSGGSAGLVGANFATQHGTATAILDYGLTQGVIAFPDGDTTTQYIVVPIPADTLVEGPEHFTLNLTQPTGGAALGPLTSITITVLDGNSAPLEPAIFASGFEE